MAFTLIELLVVIAIIAVLAAMLLPSLARSKAQAYSTVCKNHLHEMGMALRMYVDENQGYPYYCEETGNGTGQFLKWFNFLEPYYPITCNWTNPAYHCPVYQGVAYALYFPSCGSYSYNVFGCPNVGDDWYAPAFNTDGLGGFAVATSAYISPLPVKDSDVLVPSATFAIMDTLAAYVVPPCPAGQPLVPPGLITMGTGLSGLDYVGCNFVMWPYPHLKVGNASPMPHGKSYNVHFCDGHVEGVLFTNLFDPNKTAVNWNINHQPPTNTSWFPSQGACNPAIAGP